MKRAPFLISCKEVQMMVVYSIKKLITEKGSFLFKK